MNSSDDLLLTSRLNRHPALRTRVESLLNVVENTGGDCSRADDAERSVIEELRKMGNDALQSWGTAVTEKATHELREQRPELHGNGKKKVCWHTTFGVVSVIEPVFRCSGQQFRPFIRSAEVTARGCSMPLQRALTDFGADHAFGQVPKKLTEHYGIELSVSTIRRLTEYHAKQMHQQRKAASVLPLTTPGCAQQIAEIDGCMLPIVTVSESAEDQRKEKKLHWQEARLALVHEPGSTTPKFEASFGGSVDEAGQSWLTCAVTAGFGTDTQVHGVGDGACWIADQVEDKFGLQGRYLIDFYHVCDYLSEASKTCAPGARKTWMDDQKARLKNNEYPAVIAHLALYLEADEIDNDSAPVRACHRYLNNRTDQLDYRGAIEKGLPIGSGEIESAHRYVIQQRLKLSGAWWKPANVGPILALRVVRANDEWDQYWENASQAA